MQQAAKKQVVLCIWLQGMDVRSKAFWEQDLRQVVSPGHCIQPGCLALSQLSRTVLVRGEQSRARLTAQGSKPRVEISSLAGLFPHPPCTQAGGSHLL